MYEIVKEDVILVTLTNPVWVVIQDNGCLGLASEQNAQGIVIDGTVYHIQGRKKLPGCESVILHEISELTHHRKQTAEQEVRQLQIDMALAELSIIITNAISATE